MSVTGHAITTNKLNKAICDPKNQQMLFLSDSCRHEDKQRQQRRSQLVRRSSVCKLPSSSPGLLLSCRGSVLTAARFWGEKHCSPGIQQTCCASDWEELGTADRPQYVMGCNCEVSVGSVWRKRSCSIAAWHGGSIHMEERDTDEQEPYGTQAHPTCIHVHLTIYPARERFEAAPACLGEGCAARVLGS